MKKLLSILFVVAVLTSCSKAEVDERDAYVGSWNYSQTGSVKLMQNGSLVNTMAVDNSGTMAVTKYGDEMLSFDGSYASVSGNTVTFQAETQTESQNGTTMQMTVNRTGTLSGKTMIVRETYSGYYSNSNSNGIISGSSNITMTKN